MTEHLEIANSYGSVDIQDGVPEGYEHVAGKRLQPLCRRLDILYANALTGWYGTRRFPKPDLNGVVVPSEDAERLRRAIDERDARSPVRKRVLKSVESPVFELPPLSQEGFGTILLKGKPETLPRRAFRYLLRLNRSVAWDIDKSLSRLGLPGCNHESIRNKLLDRIEEMYPWLATQCELERASAETMALALKLEREGALTLRHRWVTLPSGKKKLRLFADPVEGFDGQCGGFGFRSQENAYRAYASIRLGVWRRLKEAA